jgi:hypothetical protein
MLTLENFVFELVKHIEEIFLMFRKICLQPLKDQGSQNGFLRFWTGCCECNNFF